MGLTFYDLRGSAVNRTALAEAAVPKLEKRTEPQTAADLRVRCIAVDPKEIATHPREIGSS